LYEALGNKPRMAEIHNHLAAIELQDGNPQAALEQVDKALDVGRVEGPEGQQLQIPGVLATAEHLRGSVARNQGNLGQAIEHFRRANEVAGQAGLGQLALDSGMAFGEALLISGER